MEALIAPQTVNTLPLPTLDAYRDHGAPAVRLGLTDVAQLRRELAPLQVAGIDLGDAARQLEMEGLQKFAEAYAALLHALGTDPAASRKAHA